MSIQVEQRLTSIEFVSLSRLRPGDESPVGSINVRKTDDPQQLPALKASIVAEGVVQSVLACQLNQRGDELYLAIGNRRLRALRELAAEGKIGVDYPVPAIILRGVTPAEARAMSLAENIERVPLHPVDRYEAFAQLAGEGQSVDEIAERFGLARKEVQQSLALGALSPTIRAAWRDGVIKADAAKAYTLASDHKAQDALFAKLKKRGSANADWTIRQELKADNGDAQKFVEYVGIDAYVARGGKVTRDLFGTNHVVSDPKLAKAMAEEKIAAECQRLVAEGWKWARPASEIQDKWNYGTIEAKPKPTKDETAELKRLQAIVDRDENGESDEAEAAQIEIERVETAIKARSYTAEQKAQSGCILGLDYNGAFSIEYGKLEPAETRKAAAKERTKQKQKAKDAGEPEAVISSALAHRLSCQLTVAARAAIEEEPKLALPVAIAALMTNGYAIKLSNSGMHAQEIKSEDDFPVVLSSIQKLTQPDQLKVLADIVGASFNFQTHNPVNIPLQHNGDVATMCNAIDPKRLNAELRKAFDAEDYFNSAPAKVAVAAIIEMGHPPPKGSKKADIAKTAIALATEKGWLPPELRTAHYDGAAVTKVAAKSPQKANAKPAAKPKRKAAAQPRRKAA